MLCLRTFILCLLIGLPVGSFLRAENRIFLLPAGSSTSMSVLRAENLGSAGTISTTGSVLSVFASNDGGKYYVTSRRSTDPVLVADSDTLEVTRQIPLGVASTHSTITPDGRYLLIVADRLRVIRTDTDQQVGSGIPVGAGPTQVVVNNVSSFAYVLAANGRAIQVINLSNLTLTESIEIPAATAIALSHDDSRLAAVLNGAGGVRQFRTSDYELIDTIPPVVDIISGEAFPVPGSSKLIVTSRGTAPRNTAQLFDLAGGTSKAIGSIGSVGLRQVAVVDETRAYGVLSSSTQIAVIDLTNEPEAAVTPLPLGSGFDSISLSPNRKTLYASSFTQSQMLRINVANNAVLTSQTTAQAPSGHSLAFDSSSLPPADLLINGGDGQYTPPGNELPAPLSVRLVDVDGNPVSGVPVFFTPEPSTIGVEISPGQPSITNRFGIATAFVRILPVAAAEGAAELAPPDAAAAEPFFDAQSALKELARVAASPGPIEQQANPVTEVRIIASAAGVVPLPLAINVIQGTGMIKVSGDYQITAPNRAFADPFTVLVTDKQGRPLPPRTEVNFSAFGGVCNGQTVPTDSNGFASVTCFGGAVPGSGPPYVKGGVAASVSSGSFQVPAVLFNFTVANGADQISIIKVAGDGQTGETETLLPSPLVFRISAFLPIADIGVSIRQISGPAVSISPSFLTTFPGINQSSAVTLGRNAGPIGIEVSVVSPNRPTAIFNLTAEGGQPQTVQKQGDGQAGRIGSLLPNPLRLIVFNESGEVVAFPDVKWSVLSGDAQIVAVASEPGGASARIRFGDAPGAVVVRAAIAGLTADFNLTATPPQPVSISTIAGQNQTITVGSLSAPLTVRVAEAGNVPAGNVIVTFNGPANVMFHATQGAPGLNPLQVRTDDDGVATAQAELLRVAALNPAGPGPGPSQVGNTVLVTATVGDLVTTFQLSVIGRLPSFQAAGVVNAANRSQPGQPDFLSGLVPGSLATLFGAGLSEGIGGVDLPGGATSHKGTTLRIGGIPAPLLAIKGSTPEQINFQTPFSIPPGQTTTVEVDNNGNRTTLGVIPVFSTQPGLFELTVGSGDRTAALLHQDVTNIVTPQFPARKGEIVVGFFTGGGPLNPAVTTGQLGPIPAPVIAREVAVTVDNQNAEVLFGGYAPGFLGLYQINFRVPQSALCGTQELNVRVGDTVSPFSNVSILCE